VSSKETKQYVASLAPKNTHKIVVIYNGIDSKAFKPAKDKEGLREYYHIPKDKFVCFTIRRFTFKNGIDVLLQAVRLNKDSNVFFLIGGSGPDLEKARAFVRNHQLKNVLLLGHVSDADLPKYYALSDVFILPSRQGEGFPIVVLEAFASGLPVIATKSGGHTEIIKDGLNGYIVRVGNPEQINQKISKLKQKNLNVISQNCRELAVSEFTWGAYEAKLLKVINGLVA
jgi:glycosyltransferase involved in cell wall biosynthesis